MAREYIRTVRFAVLALALLALPSIAHAQSTLTGVVKDASGAVLPGVTVEAASPVLIEKTRSVVTDGTGGYRLTDLRPGTYTLTFSLEGFSSIKRECVELLSSFTLTVNIDLEVGALAEALSVTGSARLGDLQRATKAQVLIRDALDTVPTRRTIQAMRPWIAGLSLYI